DWELPEHIVESVERNEGAAHAHLVAMIIDGAFNRAADCRPLEQAVANGESPERTREFDPQSRKLDTVRCAVGLLWRGSDALEGSFAAHDEVANIENAFLRRQIRALRIKRHPHLAAGDLRVHVGEAEEGAGVFTLDEHN